jgi:hypothetical protein
VKAPGKLKHSDGHFLFALAPRAQHRDGDYALLWIAGRNGANRVKVLPSYTDLREFRRTRGRYGRQEKRHDRRRFGERHKSS